MTPAALTQWRQRLGLTAKAAAQALGLSQNGYAAYERGWVDARLTDGHERPWLDRSSPRRWDRPIPRHVALACERLELTKRDLELIIEALWYHFAGGGGTEETRALTERIEQLHKEPTP